MSARLLPATTVFAFVSLIERQKITKKYRAYLDYDDPQNHLRNPLSLLYDVLQRADIHVLQRNGYHSVLFMAACHN